LIRRYIADAATQEWSMMAKRTATLRAIPGVLAEAMQTTLALTPSSEGQKTALREMATALETLVLMGDTIHAPDAQFDDPDITIEFDVEAGGGDEKEGRLPYGQERLLRGAGPHVLSGHRQAPEAERRLPLASDPLCQ
jgi:hypothetical protein